MAYFVYTNYSTNNSQVTIVIFHFLFARQDLIFSCNQITMNLPDDLSSYCCGHLLTIKRCGNIPILLNHCSRCHRPAFSTTEYHYLTKLWNKQKES